MMQRIAPLLFGWVFWTWVVRLGAAPAPVLVIELDNQIISPITQQYISDSIARAEREKAALLVIKLDTPGGLLESTRSIVKRIMNARVPVAVYVAPSGSRAGSAGVFITLAAHVAAMAPSTNIGAAHPVTIGPNQPDGEREGPTRRLIRRLKPDDEPTTATDRPTTGTAEREEEEEFFEEALDPMSEKIMNDTVAWIEAIARTRGRNVEWAKRAVTRSVSVDEQTALRERIVDLVAVDTADLLERIDGRKVGLLNTTVTLHTRGAPVTELPMTTRQKFLAIIAHPNIAYILMMLGTLGLIFEFTHPGLGFPGIAGLICLILALFSFQALPISYAALALVLLGLILIVAEVQVISHGLLAIGGVICLTLGSLMLVDSEDPALRVSLGLVLPLSLTVAGISLFAVNRAVRSHGQPVATGQQGMIGLVGEAATELTPEGMVFVRGENWRALATVPTRRGRPVRVLAVRGLLLEVEPVEDQIPVKEPDDESRI